MLVLTRRPNETIVIDGHIKVTLLSVQSGKVRIGIEAPPEVDIIRQEIMYRDSKAPQNVPATPGNDGAHGSDILNREMQRCRIS